MRIKVDGRGISRFPGARSGAQDPDMWGMWTPPNLLRFVLRPRVPDLRRKQIADFAVSSS